MIHQAKQSGIDIAQPQRFKRRQDVSFWNKWTYSYVNETIRRGSTQELGSNDWPLNNDEEDADILSNKLMEAWNSEVKKLGPEKASLVGMGYIEEGVLLLSATYLSKLLDWFSNANGDFNQGFGFASILALCSCTVAILHHISWWISNRLGTQLRITFVTAIYKKCMKLSISHTSSSGYIVNLVANDVNRFEEAANFFLFIGIGPVILVIATGLIYRQIGNAAFVASAVTLLVIPVQGWVSGQFGKFRRATVEPRDARLKYVSDMLNGIMMVKLYAWEKPLMDKVDGLRREEVNMMWKANILRAINLAFYQSFSTIIEFFSFGTFYLIGGVFTPSIVFTTITLLTSLKWNMGFRFPSGLQFSIESLVSFRRIKKFLLLPEIENSSNGQTTLDSDTILELKDASFSWPLSPLAASGTHSKDSKFIVSDKQTFENRSDETTKPILNSINLTVKSGQMIVVIGPVGSGKSSLLNAILREMECSPNGTISARPNLKIAYASQTPWILSGTILENILFGSSMNPARLKIVVQACALERDLLILEHGINTIVGERGITLSGGQKARLALARACYSDADLILLDDPLSAVDAKVGRELFDGCVNGLLKNKARILVTHQLQYVRAANSILLLEDGVVSAFGSYEHVMHQKSSFSVILKKFSESNEEDIETSDEQEINISPKKKIDIEDETAIGQENVSDSAPLFTKEEAAKGTVSASVYFEYFRSGASWLGISTLVAALIFGQILLIMSDYSVGQWSSQDAEQQKQPKWGSLFVTLALVAVVVVVSRSLMFFSLCIKSSLVLSQKVMNSVFQAEMRFFVENPAGRIMNRMSSDLSRVDENLPWILFDFTVQSLAVLSTVILSATILPLVLVILPPIGYIFYHVRRLYVITSRQVKRHEAITRSPVYATIPATLEGLSTVRAFGAQQRFLTNFSEFQNDNSRLAVLYLSVGRWLGMRLDIISALFLALVVFTTVGVSNVGSLHLSGANVGLILTYCLNLVGSLQWAFRQSAEVENLMTSTERVLEYTKIPPEKQPESPIIPPKNWPNKGDIQFQNLSLKYPPSDKNVLQDITLRIPAGSTVGIVGRTGAGKSSLLQALFRLVSPDGNILIDGVDTAKLPLKLLRQSISIIPQDPFCFRGTLRFNLDPTGSHSDDELWSAINAVQLQKVVSNLPGKLEAFVSENGGNFSVGERQLVCLTRAILRSSKVFVMDEATSAVDLNTDALIGKVLRDRGGVFHGATTLTIAHRLNTIIDYDYVMVLDQGKLVEFGIPVELLSKPLLAEDAYFSRLVSETGEEGQNQLLQMAIKARDVRTKKQELNKEKEQTTMK